MTAGKDLAILQLLVSTCLANEVNPEVYIADVPRPFSHGYKVRPMDLL